METELLVHQRLVVASEEAGEAAWYPEFPQAHRISQSLHPRLPSRSMMRRSSSPPHNATIPATPRVHQGALVLSPEDGRTVAPGEAPPRLVSTLTSRDRDGI